MFKTESWLVSPRIGQSGSPVATVPHSTKKVERASHLARHFKQTAFRPWAGVPPATSVTALYLK